MKLFCVIPAYNEEKNIFQAVSRVKPLVDEVIVVDDCSKDNTSQEAKKAGATVLRHPINRGQGAALETGNRYALEQGAEIIIHFDADNQFVAEEIPEVIAPLKKKEADIVFGSRFMGKESNLPKFKKRVIMPLARMTNFILFNIKTSDPQNGFRAMNRESAQAIRIENDGMAHCSEILAKAFQNKLKIKEVPITVIYHHFGQKFSGGFRIIKDIFYKKLIR